MRYSLQEAKERFSRANGEHAAYKNHCRQWQAQYESGKTGTPKETKMLYNFTAELINSQISGAVPLPLVTPREKNPMNEARAAVITAMLRKEIERLNQEVLVDTAERVTRTMGASLVMLEWDQSKKTHTRTGEISAQLYSPLEFVPQPGVVHFDDMDYWFVVREDTKERLAMRYGVAVQDIEGSEGEAEESDNEELATQVVMMYKGENGTLGYLSWAGECVLLDMPDYLNRKERVCGVCAAPVPGDGPCRCGAKNTQYQDQGGEELCGELYLKNGMRVPALQQIQSENGVRLQPRTVPYYKMEMPPLAYRVNTTKPNSLFGQSDCEAIRSLQTGCNIATSKISDKMAVAGHFTAVPSDLNIELSNEIGRVLRLTSPSQLDMLRSVQLEYNATADFAVVDNAYQYAKNILGITDVFQGKSDSNAQAAASKELMVQQAQNVQKAKKMLKEAAFARLYEVMFKMMLAFADERRCYALEDTGEVAEFYRYDFLEYDQESDRLYYYDDFVFAVDNTGTSEHDKPYMLTQIQNDYLMGAFGQAGTAEALYLLWKEREAVGYPRAKEMVQHWQTQKEAAAKLVQNTAARVTRMGTPQPALPKAQKGGEKHGLPTM